MNMTFNGTLTEPTNENVFFYAEFSNSEIFGIEIHPEFTTVSFPDGSYFFGTVDFQNDFYNWVKIKPAVFGLRMDDDTTTLEIDLPPNETIFRIEKGKNCWWAGFQTHNSRYLKRFQFDS